MRKALLVTLCGCCLATPAAAWAQSEQTPPARGIVVGHVGFADVGSGDSVRGDGLELGASAGVAPFAGALRHVTFEAGFAALRRSQVSGPGHSRALAARQFALRAVYTFGRDEKRLRPYVFGGAAVIDVDYDSQCVDCVRSFDPATQSWVSRGVIVEHIESRKLGFTAGAGLDVDIGRSFALRPEASLASTTPGSGWNWGWGAYRLGLAYRF